MFIILSFNIQALCIHWLGILILIYLDYHLTGKRSTGSWPLVNYLSLSIIRDLPFDASNSKPEKTKVRIVALFCNVLTGTKAIIAANCGCSTTYIPHSLL